MATIGIFDSGLGGLSVLRAICDILPDEHYLYYADSAFCPYGDKTAEYIRGRCRTISEDLIRKGADIIVVACNTATAAAIATLREEYSDAANPRVRERVSLLSNGRHDHIMFIGMEPAVKPAALGTKSGVIGVLATAGTLKGSKYLKTKGNFEDNCKICESVGKGFVELVENGILEGPRAEETVRASLEPLLAEGADTIVLGCTHYPFLVGVMKKIAPEGIRFIDPAPAVARRLADIMQKDHIPLSQTEELNLSKIMAQPKELDQPKENGLRASKENGSPKRPVVHLMSSGDLNALEKLFNLIYPAD